MTLPELTILLPSIRAVERERFINSLETNRADPDWPVCLDVDTEPGLPVEAINRCFARATTDWVWIANDDLVCETRGWDAMFRHCIESVSDGVAMFWPDDGLFGKRFPCFPLVHRYSVADLFPSPYRRYKIDDSIRDVIPSYRTYYIPDLVMRHNNWVTSGYGFDLGDGRIYPQHKPSMEQDSAIYYSEAQINLRAKILYHNILAIEEAAR